MTAFSLPNDGVTLSIFLTASATEVADLVVMTDGGTQDYKALLQAGPKINASVKGFYGIAPVAAPAGQRFHAYVSIFDYGGGSTSFNIAVNGGPVSSASRGTRTNALLVTDLIVSPLVESVAIWSHTNAFAPLMTTAEISALAGGADPATIHPAQLVYNSAPAQTTWTGSLKGVQTQFDEGGTTWQPDTIDQLVAAGINPDFIRFNVARGQNTGGGTNFTFNAANFYTKNGPYLSAMQNAGIRHTCTLWDNGGNWAGNISGWVAWSVDMLLYHVANYPGVLALVEVWNEPNGSWPIANPEYIQLVQALMPAIRAHSELDHIPVSIGVTAGVDMNYLQPLIDAGLLDLADAVSCHKYGSAESLETDLPPLEAAIVAAGKSIPIYLSEWGATTDAGLIVKRLSLLTTHPMVLAASYFPSKDYASFPNGGLVTDTGSAKATGTAWNDWWARVGSAVFVSRDPLTSAAYSLLFANDTRIMWATVDTAILVDGVAGTTLTTTPVYLDGVHTIELDTSGPVLIGDFRSDFKSTQDDPWEYGWHNDVDAWTLLAWDATNNRWADASVGSFFWIKNTGMHPTGAGNWIGPRIQIQTAGNYRISGFFTRNAGTGDGVACRIRLDDGRVLATGFSNNGIQRNFDFVATIAVGSRVEFAINAKAANTNDFTSLSATIETSTAAQSALPFNMDTTDDVLRLDLAPDGSVTMTAIKPGTLLYNSASGWTWTGA